MVILSGNAKEEPDYERNDRDEYVGRITSTICFLVHRRIGLSLSGWGYGIELDV